MKIQFKEVVNKEVQYLKVIANVRYWEDAEVNGVEDTEGELIPCREGDSWCPIIDLDNGKITNWKQGTTADIHYKVCDAGTYILCDKDFNTVLSIDGYVPNMMSPKEQGYGDYIKMDVDANGVISKWKVDFRDFLED